MSSLIKFLLYAIGVVVVLLVLAIGALVAFVDPNEYKPQIAQAVKDATGRELTLQGDFSLKFFPWLGVEFGPLSLSNAPGFEQPVFFEAEGGGVSVGIPALLSQKLEISTLYINSPTIHLEKNASGKTNWDDLAGEKKPADKQAEQPAEKPAEPAQPGAMPLELAFGGLKITNALLSWDDRQAGQTYFIRNLNVSTGAIAPGAPFPLSTSLTLDAKSMNTMVDIALETEALLEPEKQLYALNGLNLDVDVKGEAAPGGAMNVNLQGSLAADLAKETVNIRDLLLETLGLSIAGSLSGEQIMSKPSIGGALVINEFNPRDVMVKAGAEAPPTADDSVLRSVSGSMDLAATDASAAISNLILKLDDTTVTGSAGVKNFETQAIAFDLKVDGIDLDRYMPPPAEGRTEQQAPAPAEQSPAEKPDLEPLRALNLDGKTTIGRLKASGLTMTDVTVILKAKDGLLQLAPFSSALYDGSARLNASLDARTDSPAIKISKAVDKVAVGPLLKDMSGDDPLSGTASFNADLTGVGMDPDAVMSTLDGTMSFVVADGALKGVNIPQMIRDAKAKVGLTSKAEAGQAKQTDFTEMTGTATIVDGLMTNNDLAMKSPLLRLAGEGQVDLPKQTVDYLLTAYLAATLEGQGGAGVEDVKDLPVPVRVTGSLSAPSYKPDLEALGKELLKKQGVGKAKEAVEKQVQEQKEKVQEQIMEKLPVPGGLLKQDGDAGKDEEGGSKLPSIKKLF